MSAPTASGFAASWAASGSLDSTKSSEPAEPAVDAPPATGDAAPATRLPATAIAATTTRHLRLLILSPLARDGLNLRSTRLGPCALPIVFVSAERTESYDRVAGLLLGADEYLAKPVAPNELLIRIERLLRRSGPVAPTVAAKLTGRELEVMSLLADGLAAAEIAARLVISPKTVSTHIDRILRKLGVRSRAQAVALAYRRDLVSAAV
jgi:DNA-binding CsgD family transcriptional regulator